jgi:hypothetical protein
MGAPQSREKLLRKQLPIGANREGAKSAKERKKYI